MEATKPGQDAKRDQATSDREAADGANGSAHAEEEDIGTEGAGTEPGTSADGGPAGGSSSDDARAG